MLDLVWLVWPHRLLGPIPVAGQSLPHTSMSLLGWEWGTEKFRMLFGTASCYWTILAISD